MPLMLPIVVFTAQVGAASDQVRAPLAVDPTAQYLCFADRPVTVPPYEWIQVPVSDDPRLASRRIKILADHPRLRGAMTLWHDASYQLTRDVAWVREALDGLDDLVALRHVRATRTLKVEALRLVKYGYVSKATALAHFRRYRAAGFSLRQPVTCGGLLARRPSRRMTLFNRLWWREVQRWGGRDQTSLTYAAWQTGILIGHLEGQIKDNGYAQWRAAEEPIPA